jgi:quercetin dioxygenase-like cupin family protein
VVRPWIVPEVAEEPPDGGERNEPMSEEAKVTPYVDTVEEGTAYWMVDILWVMLTTGEQTGGRYSLMWELCPKGSGPGPHYHDQDEQFYVIDGEITYLANGKELKAKSGSFVLIPRGTVHSFRVDSETATILNSYTPAGFERTITELAEPAGTHEIPPPDRPDIPAGIDKAITLFRKIGMHIVEEPDVLREGRKEV